MAPKKDELDPRFEALAEQLNDLQPKVRHAAILELHYSQPAEDSKEQEQVTTLIAGCIADIDDEVRSAAALALAKVGKVPLAITLVCAHLTNWKGAVRRAAADMLDRLINKPQPGDVVKCLLQALQDADSEVRHRIAKILPRCVSVSVTETMCTAVQAALKPDHPNALLPANRALNAEVLSKVCKPGHISTAATLMKLLKDVAPEVRRAAAEGLGRMAKGDQSAITALCALLRSDSSLRRIGEGLADEKARLEEQLAFEAEERKRAEELAKWGAPPPPGDNDSSDSDEEIKARKKRDKEFAEKKKKMAAAKAAKANGQVAAPPPVADPNEVTGVADADPGVREAALGALEAIATNTSWDAIAAFAASLEDPAGEVRQAAAHALAALDPGEGLGINAALKRLHHPVNGVRMASVQALVALSPPGSERVATELAARYKDCHSRITNGRAGLEERVAVLEALALISPPGHRGAVTAVLLGLEDPTADVRRASLRAAPSLVDEEEDETEQALVIAGVAARLKDRDMSVRAAAEKALVMLGVEDVTKTRVILNNRAETTQGFHHFMTFSPPSTAMQDMLSRPKTCPP